MTLNLYRFDKNCEIVEKGAADLQAALTILRDCVSASRQSYEWGEEAIAATNFGLARTDENFLEIACNGPDQIAFHSDLLHASFWGRLLGKGHLEWECDQISAERVVADYFDLSRPDFESKYR